MTCLLLNTEFENSLLILNGRHSDNAGLFVGIDEAVRYLVVRPFVLAEFLVGTIYRRHSDILDVRYIGAGWIEKHDVVPGAHGAWVSDALKSSRSYNVAHVLARNVQRLLLAGNNRPRQLLGESSEQPIHVASPRDVHGLFR